MPSLLTNTGVGIGLIEVTVFLTTDTRPSFNPEALAVIVNSPTLLSGLTTTNALPEKAGLILDWKLNVEVGSPLSVPTIVPPVTLNVISLVAVPQKYPFASSILHSTKTRSSLSLSTVDLSAINSILLGVPLVLTTS